MTEATRRLALARFGLLRPHLENGVSLSRLAGQHSVPLRTLERWLRKYRQDGLDGLVRKPYANRGRRRLPTELQHLIEGLALRRPPLSSAAVHREASVVARARGWPEPSYDTVHQIIRQLPAALVTLAHEGTKVYADRFDLLYRREASRPNEMWQADHTPLDIGVLDEHNRPARPWLTKEMHSGWAWTPVNCGGRSLRQTERLPGARDESSAAANGYPSTSSGDGAGWPTTVPFISQNPA